MFFEFESFYVRFAYVTLQPVNHKEVGGAYPDYRNITVKGFYKKDQVRFVLIWRFLVRIILFQCDSVWEKGSHMVLMVSGISPLVYNGKNIPHSFASLTRVRLFLPLYTRDEIAWSHFKTMWEP